jgi:hypothetical protein
MSSVDRTILNLVKNLNRHVPTRRSLRELLEEERPYVKGRDGKRQSISKQELLLIAETLPSEQWDRLRLPLLLEMSADFETTAARVQGSLECEVIRKLLGFPKSGNRIVLYLPEIQLLRRTLPTTTQYVFHMRVQT